MFEGGLSGEDDILRPNIEDRSSRGPALSMLPYISDVGWYVNMGLESRREGKTHPYSQRLPFGAKVAMGSGYITAAQCRY